MGKFDQAVLGVTGAGGHLGRAVVEGLLAAGARHVVALTRAPAGLADLQARGVEVRAASFDQPADLAQAFSGIERLLLISTDNLPQRKIQQQAAVDAAVAAGVSHLLYTGITSPYPDATSPLVDSHFWTEIRIAASGRDFSLLRNNLYTDYLIPPAQHAIASGALMHAAGTGARAFVTRADCAAAAVGALRNAEGKHIYDVSGPAAVTADDLAALYADVSGKPVAARNIPPADLEVGLKSAGVPDDLAAALTRFDVDTARGALAIVTDAVANLAGRPPQSVAQFLAANATALKP